MRDIFTRERKLFLNRIGKDTPERPTLDDVLAALALIGFIAICLFGFAFGWHLANIF